MTYAIVWSRYSVFLFQKEKSLRGRVLWAILILSYVSYQPLSQSVGGTHQFLVSEYATTGHEAEDGCNDGQRGSKGQRLGECSLLDEYGKGYVPEDVDQDGKEAHSGLQGSLLEHKDGNERDGRCEYLYAKEQPALEMHHT